MMDGEWNRSGGRTPGPLLRIGLLEKFRLHAGDSDTERVLPPRLQLLVALLTLRAGIPQTREHVAELFWPEASEDHARGGLRKLLFDLHQFVPEAGQLLQTDRTTVCWMTGGEWTLDVRLFENAAREANDLASLERSLDCYTGELLPACYDEWIAFERERLRALYLGVLRRAMEAAEEAHDYARAIEHGNRLLREEPLHEEVYRALMRLHALSDDRAAALRAYHACSTMLQRELGIEPAPATQEAYELLRQSDDSTPYRSVTAFPLVGRQAEWTALQSAWRSSLRGRAGAVLLSGEPGIGKTRLLEELLDWAGKQGVPVSNARCYAAEAALAYAPIAALLRSSVVFPGTGSEASESPVLDRIWLTEVARIIPELLSIYPDLPAPGPLTESWQRARFFEALAQVVLVRQPVLLAIDDVHWADSDTLEWLAFLVRRHADARLLLVCTSRPERMSAGTDESPWSNLHGDGSMQAIDLAPLSREATFELATSAGHALDAERERDIWQETEGNPLFIIEMMRTDQSQPAPASIGSVLDARLGQLTARARQLAHTAAVIGRDFNLSVLLTADPQDGEDCLRGLDELWSHRIIREHGADAYDFSHEKLRQAVYDSIPSPRRRLIHQRVADALIAANAGSIDPVAANVAAHFEEAGLAVKAGPYHVLAGDAARRVHATDAATTEYRRALETLPAEAKLDVIVKLGELFQVTGSAEEGPPLLLEGIELAKAQGDRRGVAHCRHLLGGFLRLAGDYGGAERELLKARADLEAMQENALLSSTLAQLAATHTERGQYAQAATLLQEAMRRAETAGDERALANATGSLAVLYFYQLELDHAGLYFNKLLALPGTAQDPRRQGIALVNLGIVAEEQGKYAESLDILQDGYQVLRAAGEGVMAAATVLNMSAGFRKLGDLTRAKRCCIVAASLAVDVGYWHAVHISLAHLGHVEASNGHLDEAERLLLSAIQPMRDEHLSFHLCEALYFLADLYERKGNLEASLHAAEEAMTVAREVKRHDYALVAEILVIRLKCALGRIDLSAAVARLSDMDDVSLAPHRRALLAYARWELDRSREADRRQAARLYAGLHPSRPNYLYRERYRDLTGVDLPPPDVPDLLASIRDFAGSTDELLASAEAEVARHFVASGATKTM